MKKGSVYTAYGVVILILFAGAHYTGFGFTGPSKERGGPKTVRDNPGASRPQYSGNSRYVGGK